MAAAASVVNPKLCLCGEPIYRLIFCATHYDAMGKSHTKYKEFEEVIEKVLSEKNMSLRDIRCGEFKESDLKTLENKEIFRIRRMIAKSLNDRENHRSTFYPDHPDEKHNNIIDNYHKFISILKSLIVYPAYHKLIIPCPIMIHRVKPTKKPAQPKATGKIKTIDKKSKPDMTPFEIENFNKGIIPNGDIVKNYNLNIGTVIKCWETPAGCDSYIAYSKTVATHKIIKIFEGATISILLDNGVKLSFSKGNWFDDEINSPHQIQYDADKRGFLNAFNKYVLTDFFRTFEFPDEIRKSQLRTRVFTIGGILARINALPFYKWNISIANPELKDLKCSQPSLDSLVMETNVEFPMEGYTIDSIIEIVSFWALAIRKNIKNMKKSTQSTINKWVDASVNIYVSTIFDSMVKIGRESDPSSIWADDKIFPPFSQKYSPEFSALTEQIEAIIKNVEDYLLRRTVAHLVLDSTLSPFWESSNVLFPMYLEIFILKILSIIAFLNADFRNEGDDYVANTLIL
ncbi:MAG: hypothetical protein Hyperionvirus27_13 [Hyperionvirus sp.]|uniref:Uncharacterized protein n=1 Tax=Hyperionvirus sp. TaxID=2487770 RepID=A0A3G5AF27_9VIRU|nr:MAG: hypothetical protein Hyperionvirus27_13 [Hyperionvirus sp.]